jgi:hypothetical protein
MAWIQKNRAAIRLRSVYAEASNGGPLGRWLHQITTRPVCVKALLVQLTGFG